MVATQKCQIIEIGPSKRKLWLIEFNKLHTSHHSYSTMMTCAFVQRSSKGSNMEGTSQLPWPWGADSDAVLVGSLCGPLGGRWATGGALIACGLPILDVRGRGPGIMFTAGEWLLKTHLHIYIIT